MAQSGDRHNNGGVPFQPGPPPPSSQDAISSQNDSVSPVVWLISGLAGLVSIVSSVLAAPIDEFGAAGAAGRAVGGLVFPLIVGAILWKWKGKSSGVIGFAVTIFLRLFLLTS